MGISFSTNTSGINNFNIFASLGIGDENVKTLAGLFSCFNLEGGPLVRGFFGETNIVGHSLNVTYANISNIGENLQGGIRLRVFKDKLMDVDLNLYHSITNMANNFRFNRFGGNICWSFPEGTMLAIGASHARSLNTTTIDFVGKVNVWKSQSESTTIDLTTNITHYVEGPLVGHQNAVVSLTVLFDLLNLKEMKNEQIPFQN